MNAREIAAALGGAKETTNGWIACCPVPAHGKGRGDRNPSLSLANGANGSPVVHCHAGCPQESVIAALRAKGTWPVNGAGSPTAIPDRPSDVWHPLVPVPDDAPQPPSHPRYGRPGSRWDYRDACGELLGYVARFDGVGGTKQVLPLTYCQLGENREWRWQSFPAPRPLYGLDRLTQRPDAGVIVAEGEKAADAAGSLLPQYVAITSPGGCKAAAISDWSSLKGRHVIIWPDADEPGRTYAAEVAELCRSAEVETVSIIDPPGEVSKGWDAADALDEGWNQGRALELVQDASPAKAASVKTRLRADTVGDFLALEIPPRELILEPFLPSQGLAMMFAKRGIGKTHLSLGVAYAVACGSDFLKWSAPEPRKVLFVDGEMPACVIQERLAAIVAGNEVEPPAPDHLRLVTPDRQELGMPDLATLDGQAAVDELVEDVDLIILDNLSCLFRAGRENEADDWTVVQDWLLRLRRRGKTVLFVHHAGKNGDQRGTSRREDVLDSVISLKRPADYHADEGARFEVHYEKARGFTGEDAKPFEAMLETRDGAAVWSVKSLEESRVEKVAALLNDGHSQQEIADLLDIDKSNVSRHAKRARELGLVQNSNDL
ncbi:MAG TPA: AAA family ATPase [Hyphomicrobiaceae bacterium]|nr:AAA family ATPase [Hyphomicrobiaceae bacterium]